MNYYNPEKKQTITRALMDNMGLPKDDAALAALGWYPIEYAYREYDTRRQELLPDGEPVRNGAGFVQNFSVASLDAERLAASLARYKNAALERLKAKFEDAEKSGRLQSSAGFAIDATERANRDISGLITMLEEKGESQAMFCGADNEMRPVTLEQLKAMRLEVIGYGQTLYAKKWQLRSSIENAATFEDVDGVDIVFA